MSWRGGGTGGDVRSQGETPVAFLHWILMELISIKTVFRFELTQDYGLRYPLGLFRMVIRINPKGYYLHIYLHRFAVVLSSIQIAAANGWWLLQQRRRAASTLTCLHLHLRLHLRLRLHKKNQHNQSTASHQPPPSPQPPG